MKLIIIVLIATLFYYYSLTAQKIEQVSENKDTKSSFFAGLYVAPSFIGSPAYRYYYYSVPGKGGNLLIWGALAGFNLRNKLAIQTGFEYSSEKVFSPEDIKVNFPALSGLGNYYKAVYDVHYFQVPIIFKTFLNNSQKKLRWYLPLGTVYRNTVAEERLTEFTSETQVFKEETTTLKEQTWFINFGIGAQFRLNEKFTVLAEPAYRYCLLNKDERFDWHRSFRHAKGINIGLNYNFN